MSNTSVLWGCFLSIPRMSISTFSCSFSLSLQQWIPQSPARASCSGSRCKYLCPFPLCVQNPPMGQSPAPSLPMSPTPTSTVGQKSI